MAAARAERERADREREKEDREKEKQLRAIEREYAALQKSARESLNKLKEYSGKHEDLNHWQRVAKQGPTKIADYFKKSSRSLKEMQVTTEHQFKVFKATYEGDRDVWREIAQSLSIKLPQTLSERAGMQECLKREVVLQNIHESEEFSQRVRDTVDAISDQPHPSVMMDYICKELNEMTMAEERVTKCELWKLKCEGPKVEDFEKFVAKLESYCRLLENAESKVQDSDKRNILLSGVSREHDGVKSTLEREKRTYLECLMALRNSYHDSKVRYDERKARDGNKKEKGKGGENHGYKT